MMLYKINFNRNVNRCAALSVRVSVGIQGACLSAEWGFPSTYTKAEIKALIRRVGVCYVCVKQSPRVSSTSALAAIVFLAPTYFSLANLFLHFSPLAHPSVFK